MTKEWLNSHNPNRGLNGLRPPHPLLQWLPEEVTPRTPRHCEVAPSNRGLEVEFLLDLHQFACLHQWQHGFLHFATLLSRFSLWEHLSSSASSSVQVPTVVGKFSARFCSFPRGCAPYMLEAVYTSPRDDLRSCSTPMYVHTPVCACLQSIKFRAKCGEGMEYEMVSQQNKQFGLCVVVSCTEWMFAIRNLHVHCHM